MTRTGLSAELCVPNMLSAHVSATFAAPTYDPRWEPDAVIPHVRICGGGGEQPPSLLLPNDDRVRRPKNTASPDQPCPPSVMWTRV
jgi:hypothetical protein